MKKTSKLLALLLALAMVFALAACGSSSSGSSDSSSTTSGDTSSSDSTGDSSVNLITADAGMSIDTTGVDLSGLTIGFVTVMASAPWGGRVGTEFARMAEEAGATVNSLDANGDNDAVTNYCQQMIDAGVDILAVFGGTPDAMVDIAKTCSEEGIGLFLCGLDVAEEGREYATACIGPDQQQAFYDIGQYIIDLYGDDAALNVVQISGVPSLEDYIEREAGFADVMSSTNYNLYAADYAFSSRTDAKAFMESHIQADGDSIDIVMGYDDDLTMGAVAAIEEAGLTDDIAVFSFTGQADAIQAVIDGQMVMTVMNRADDIAAEACVAVYEWVTTGSTEYYHRTPLVYITADNAADYLDLAEF